jgi:hypothetical protein
MIFLKRHCNKYDLKHQLHLQPSKISIQMLCLMELFLRQVLTKCRYNSLMLEHPLNSLSLLYLSTDLLKHNCPNPSPKTMRNMCLFFALMFSNTCLRLLMMLHFVLYQIRNSYRRIDRRCC